jgi:DNA repair protein RecO (recombination protein O)
MLHKVKAIVLRTTRYSETSVIALMYTDLFGMQSYMINGVRKQKAKITAGMLQPLCLVDAEVYHKTQGDIQRLNELRLEPVLNGILSDPSRGVVAMFAAEVLTRAIREEEGQQELFDYLSHHIQLLDIHPQPLFALLQLLLGLSARLGFQPEARGAGGNWLNLTEGRFEAQRDQRSAYARPESADQIAVLLDQRLLNKLEVKRNTLRDMLLLYQLHLPGFKPPKATDMLEELFFMA